MEKVFFDPSYRHVWGSCPKSIDSFSNKVRSYSGKKEAIDLRSLFVAAVVDCAPLSVGSSVDGVTVTADAKELVERSIDDLSSLGIDLSISKVCTLKTKFGWRDDAIGVIDACIHTPERPDTLYLVDFVSGMTEIQAKDNPKLKMLMASLEVDLALFWDVKSISLVILQPRIGVLGKTTVKEWNVPLTLLQDFKKETIAEIAAIENGSRDAKPGTLQCKSCRDLECGSRFRMIEDVLNVPFDELLNFKLAETDVSKLTDKQLFRLVESAPLIRNFLTNVEDFVRDRLIEGGALPGCTLAKGKGSRVWNVDEKEVVKKLVELGAPENACYSKKLVSPAQASKLSWVTDDGEVVTLSKSAFQKLQKEVVSVVEGKPVLVLDTDSRVEQVSEIDNFFKGS